MKTMRQTPFRHQRGSGSATVRVSTESSWTAWFPAFDHVKMERAARAGQTTTRQFTTREMAVITLTSPLLWEAPKALPPCLWPGLSEKQGRASPLSGSGLP